MQNTIIDGSMPIEQAVRETNIFVRLGCWKNTVALYCRGCWALHETCRRAMLNITFFLLMFIFLPTFWFSQWFCKIKYLL